MNKVIETIFERRSIRTFEPRAIETERVAEILECGRRAPNAWGHQSFELFAITDPLLMDELAALTAKNRVVTSIGAFGYPAGAPREKELVTKIHYINQEGSL